VDLAGGSPFIICDVVGLFRGASWSSDGRIVFTSLSHGLFQVLASGGAPSPLTILDASRGESFHFWPQVLPGGRFLFWVRAEKPENTGIYAASFARPDERKQLLSADANALYAPGGDGRDYLLWLRGGTLLAQEFDPSTLALAGEPHPVADPVSQIGIIGLMNIAVSARGQLLYSAAHASGQFTWLDRKGRRLSVVGEPGEYSSFRLSPTDAASWQLVPGGAAPICGSWTWNAARPAGLLTLAATLTPIPYGRPAGGPSCFTAVSRFAV
jgi:serine/threonine-protein kinase